MRMAQARRMTAVCDVVRNPAVGETGMTAVVSALVCTPAFPLDSVSKWGVLTEMATDYELLEMSTVPNADVQRFDVVTVDSQLLTISRLRRYPARGFADGYLHLLLEDRT